jgi:HEPN domain-containing protein
MRNDQTHEGRRWLDQAEVDVGWCCRLHEQGAFYLVCFLAQQAAEKALKAILYAHGEELVIGHSVRQLCHRAAEYAEACRRHTDQWGILDSYYIPTRYPNGLPDGIPADVYNRETSASALALAEAVLEAVKAWFAKGDAGETVSQ